jgi:hypothetical protein
MKPWLTAVGAATMIAFAPMGARATTTVYTDEADFAAASSDPVQQTSPVIICSPTVTSCNVDVTTVVSEPFPALVLTTDPGDSINYTNADYYGPTAYPHDFLTEGYDPTISNHLYINFPFPGTISAFGFDIGTYNSTDLQIATDDGTTLDDPAPAGFGHTEFVGFVSDTYLNTITITLPTLNDTWLIDRFYIGYPTALDVGSVVAAGPAPEPGAWMLILTGFGLVGGAARRRPSHKVARS